ncbi:MAG: antibiotic biosynthesis monooxygenase [Arenicella sp.]|nr:antibiotic biosynthesis monooxygenase [Arenicella sp.]
MVELTSSEINPPQSESNVAFGMQVVMTATSGNGEQLAALMLQASELVAPLKGCKLYLVQLSTSAQDSALITEVWESKEDHAASLSVPAVQEIISRARPLIADMAHHTGIPLGGHGI